MTAVPGKRGARHLTLLTFIALAVVMIVVEGLGLGLLFGAVDRAMERLQVANNADSGARFAHALSTQINPGADEKRMLARMQQFLATLPIDGGRYFCIISADAQVLCHPAAEKIGKPVAALRVRSLDGKSVAMFSDWLKGRSSDGKLLDNDGNTIELIRRVPVEGATWQVVVHTQMAVIEAEAQKVKRNIAAIFIPIGIAILSIGTLVVRLAGRRYEEGIERANALLEERVHIRTQELSATIGELQQTREALALSEKMALLGQLVAGIAHEINNPLQAIGTYASVLEDEVTTDDGRRAVKGIERSNERCALLVRNLLAYARNDPPDLKETPVNALVETALGFCSVELRNGQVQVEKALAPGNPSLRVDRTQLEQVILNLVLNAAEALQDQPEPRQVRIATANGGSHVRLTVEDNGPGLPPQIESHLFEPFHTTKPEGKGTGLGLSLCRRFVEHHGGTIRHERRDGGGARFLIELPLG